MPIFRPFFFQKINPSEEFPTLVKSYLLVSSRWTVYFARVKLNLVKLGIDPLLPESSLYSRTAQLIQQDSNSTWGKGQVKMQLYASFSRHSIQNVIFGRFKLNHSTYNCFIWIDLRAHQPQSHLPARDQPEGQTLLNFPRLFIIGFFSFNFKM